MMFGTISNEDAKKFKGFSIPSRIVRVCVRTELLTDGCAHSGYRTKLKFER